MPQLAYSTRVGSDTPALSDVAASSDSADAAVRVLMLGDSMTADPMRRRHVQRFVRMQTSGVQFVGTIGLGAATGGIIGDQEMQWWCHDGVSGNTIAQILARIPTIAASLGASRAPHIVDLLMGANDISALASLASIETSARAVIEAIRSAWPGVWIILNAPAIFSAGAGTGFDTKDALRAQVASLYETLSAEYPRIRFVDALSGMTVSEQLSDGVHLNEHGAALTAKAEADAIVQLIGARLPTTAIAAYYPSSRSALVFDTPASDVATIASDADLAPGTDSFLVSIRFMLDAFPPDGSVYNVVTLGATIPDGYTMAVFKVAGIAKAGISVYLANGQSVITGNAGYPSNLLELAREYEVTIVADATEDKIGLWVDGKTIIQSIDLVALGRGSNWNIAAASTRIGDATINGIQGKIRRFAFLKGAAVPSIWDAPRVAEELYHRGRLPGTPILYMLNEGTGSPAEQQGRAGTVTLSGVTWGTV